MWSTEKGAGAGRDKATPPVGDIGEMSQRDRQKSGGPVARVSNRGASPRGEQDNIDELKRDRDNLKAALAAADLRIRELERERSDILNRIDWVIDSLHNLVEGRN